MPQRIQRKRTKGWRMPAGTVSVTRPSHFGNPYVVGIHGDAARCVELFVQRYEHEAGYQQAAQAHLAGQDLACYYALGTPCHADVLLRWANGPDV